MQVNKSYWYILIFCLQLGMLFFVFPAFFSNPQGHVLCNDYDGQRNNHSLISYVREPITAEGIFKYNAVNYPYGDYVYTTDNTPFIAIPLRWIHYHIKELSNGDILFVYNSLILLNFIVCALLIFYLFTTLGLHSLLAFIASLVLTWANYQALRISAGHYNLSLTSLVLFSLVLVVIWHRKVSNFMSGLSWLLYTIIFGVVLFLIHGYYIAILTGFIGCSVILLGISSFRSKLGKQKILFGFLILIGTVGATLLLLYNTDAYYNLRLSYAKGYDWSEGKTNFSLLFSAYDFHSVRFPLRIQKNNIGIELYQYLGNISLYGVLFVFIGMVINASFRHRIYSIQKKLFSDIPFRTMMLASLLLLSISFGEQYYIMHNKLMLVWPLKWNPQYPLWFYIGFFMLLAVALIWAIHLLVKQRLEIWSTIKELNWKKEYILFLLVSGVVLYIMFGHYHVNKVVNVFNPFLFLHKITLTVEQFRSLSRFSWPFFWMFNLWAFLTLSQLFITYSKSKKILMVLAILLVGLPELYDFSIDRKLNSNRESIYSPTALKHFDTLKVRLSDYQAVALMPYFTIGSEDYELTIDDYPENSNFLFQLNIHSGLPMMNTKLGRIPPQFVKETFDWIKGGVFSKNAKKLMNNKPILIVVNNRLLADSSINCIPNKEQYPNAHAAYWNSLTFCNRFNLKKVDSLGDFHFYSCPVR